MPACLNPGAGANVFSFIEFWSKWRPSAKFLFMATYMHIFLGDFREQLPSDFPALSEPVGLRSQEDPDEGQNIDL
jgi:hypothetical protein